MNFTDMAPQSFLKSNSSHSKSVFYKCNACKKQVDVTELRTHAENHNPVFKFFEWHKILGLYTIDF